MASTRSRTAGNPGSATPVTMRDIAGQVGVSVATVSRALAGNPCVSPETRAAIQGVADCLGYRPNLVARSLRTNRTFVVGVVIPDIGNPFFAGLVRGIEDVVAGSDYAVMSASSVDDPSRELSLLRALVSRNVDGVVLAVVDSHRSSVAPLVDADTPFVLVDRLLDGAFADSVSVDNENGAAHAVDYMATRGHRKIAIIAGPQRVSNAVSRLAGYRQAVSRLGISADGLVFYGDYTEASGARIAHQVLRMAAPPDAILVCNNLMTLGCYKVVSAAGWRIPHDIAIVGFDDSDWAALAHPPVTVVDQSPFDLGQQSAQLLLDRLADRVGSDDVRKIVLPTELIRRGTC